MKLKKLLPELAEKIVEAGFDKEPRPIQAKVISSIKSGHDLFLIAPEGAGKSTVLNISVIDILKAPFQKAPRAIIVVKDKDSAFAMDKQFEMLSENTGLRSLLVYDEGRLLYQKDMIYEGIDLLITTPKRLAELLNSTGVPLGALKLLIIDDAEFLFKGQSNTILHRMTDSIGKLQIVVAASKWTDRFYELNERVMRTPSTTNFIKEGDF